jgi:uncharacterized protein YjbJ (UPF0337 family)
MNWDQVEGNWKQLRGKVQTQWGKLTNHDLDVIKGRCTEFEGHIQKHDGYAKDKAKSEVDAWLSKLK